MSPPTGVNLDGNPLADDRLMADLGGCLQMTVLRLGGTKVTDAGLAVVGFDRGRLTHLDLFETAATDTGLKRFEGCPALTYLQLGGTGLTDAGLAHFRDSTRLRWVNLQQTAVSDRGLSLFSTTPSLETLSFLRAENVTNRGLACLEDCSALRELRLNGTRMTKPGVRRLQQRLPKCVILDDAPDE